MAPYFLRFPGLVPKLSFLSFLISSSLLSLFYCILMPFPIVLPCCGVLFRKGSLEGPCLEVICIKLVQLCQPSPWDTIGVGKTPSIQLQFLKLFSGTFQRLPSGYFGILLFSDLQWHCWFSLFLFTKWWYLAGLVAVSDLKPLTFTLRLCRASCHLSLVNVVRELLVLQCSAFLCFYMAIQRSQNYVSMVATIFAEFLTQFFWVVKFIWV